MARQTWTDLQSRLKIILRNRDDADINTRMAVWMRQSKSEIEAAYRFTILQKMTSRTLITGVQSIDISDIADLRYISHIRNTTTKRVIAQKSMLEIDKSDFTSVGEPSRWSRYGPTVEFDRTSDKNYQLLFRYKAFSADPVYNSVAVPITPDCWDDVILARAAKKGWMELYETDRAEYWRSEEMRLLSELPTQEVVELEEAYPQIQPQV